MLHELVDQGNTVVVIEHNLDVVKTADWIVDFGPEGGDGGGEIVAVGTPEQVAANPKSWTGRYLAELLERHGQRRKGRVKKLVSGLAVASLERWVRVAFGSIDLRLEMTMILYGAPKPAPNPRRVRIFLAEKGIDLPETPVDMMKREHKSPEFRAKNSMGQLPALELDDGTCISETVAICRYFDETHPEPPMFGTDAGGEGPGRHVGAPHRVHGDDAGGQLLAPRPPAHRRPAHPVQGLRGEQQARPTKGAQRYLDRELDGEDLAGRRQLTRWPTSASSRRWISRAGSACRSRRSTRT